MVHALYTFSENLRLMWPKIRSPGQENRYIVRVKCKFSSNAGESHNSWPNLLKLSGCIEFTEFYDIYFGIVFYICDLSSNIAHDLVMFIIWGNFEIVPILKILKISASFYCCIVYVLPCQLIYRYVTKLFLVCHTFSRWGSNKVTWGQYTL